MMPCRLHSSLGYPSTGAFRGFQISELRSGRRQLSSAGSPRRQRGARCRSAAEGQEAKDGGQTSVSEPEVVVRPPALDKEVTKFARSAATTFAPRASGPSKNPAYPGSILYKVFEWQAYISVVVGGLLSYNIIFPSDKPDIARLIGAAEKDALNLLFLGIPLVNITLPLSCSSLAAAGMLCLSAYMVDVITAAKTQRNLCLLIMWKSFPFIYTVDCIIMASVYSWKLWLPALEERRK